MTEADQKKTVIIEEKASDREPFDPPTVATHRAHSDVSSLSDKDEALLFLGSNPRREELVNDAQALLDDPLQRRKLLRKIDFAIVPLLGLAFLVNLLDKAALEVSALGDDPRPAVARNSANVSQVLMSFAVLCGDGPPRGRTSQRPAVQ